MTLLPLHRLLLRQLDEAPADAGNVDQSALGDPVRWTRVATHKSLVALERAGLVRYLGSTLWTLTAAGRATVEAQREHERYLGQSLDAPPGAGRRG